MHLSTDGCICLHSLNNGEAQEVATKEGGLVVMRKQLGNIITYMLDKHGNEKYSFRNARRAAVVKKFKQLVKEHC